MVHEAEADDFFNQERIRYLNVISLTPILDMPEDRILGGQSRVVQQQDFFCADRLDSCCY
jgi:hypothetical protein